MKKFYMLICLGFAVMNSWGQLLYEPFNYTPDAVNGIAQQSGGVWVRINTGDSIFVTSGNLSYAGLPASTGNKISFDGSGSDNYRVYAAQTSGVVYYSFILNVSSLGTLNTTGTYFTGLIQTASTSAFGGTVWTRQSTTSGKFNVGVSTRSNSAVSWLAADLDPGTPYFIVAAYEIITGTANDVAKIWLNTAAIGGTEPAPDATSVPGTDLTAAGIERILLRQDGVNTTPFINLDEIRVGTTWADVTPSASVPVLNISSPLTPFGNVCINTTAGPNSFTISGSNLTTANITVAALTGFTYSTSSGGTYTVSLNLTQPGGNYSQQVFVKFDPTAVQSYNGNIVVAGGGAGSVNAAASGAGVNTMPSVTTGAATSITQTTATAAGTITATGCTAITAYGIEYSTTAGFPPGTGLQVGSSNLSGGNFSSGLTGLTASTTYYYRAYATNGGGTAYGSEQTFVTASPNPTINTTALSAFGNVCINTTAGPNSFTISGANLTTANITVGALAGFTYSTTAGGTYTPSLSLAQPGGTYTQQIFVQFTPTAVQSYNGNIPVGGGGVAAPVNVAASGAGVNAAPTVTTGAASAITQTTATAAGTVSSIGCSAVTAYGIEYSLINGFANGTGTPAASSNLAGGNFSSSLSGLVPSTTYYYKAFATNAGGTAYGAQQSFTTASPVLSATALAAFGTACILTTAGPNSFTLTGVGLTNTNVVVGPLNGYTFSTSSGGTYTASLNLTQGGGAYTQAVFVKFTPTLVQSYNGNIPVSGGGASAINVAVLGSGVNTLATVITGIASNLTNHSAELAGSIASTGCSNVSETGIEFSGITGFVNGTGTKVLSTNLTGSNFSSSLAGLVQGATYYYKAYAVNNGGISYGLQESFTVPAIANEFTFYPVPVNRGAGMRVTMNNLVPGNYSLLFFSSDGKLAHQHNLNIQANFINQVIVIPYSLPMGVYRVQLTDQLKLLATKSIIIE